MMQRISSLRMSAYWVIVANQCSLTSNQLYQQHHISSHFHLITHNLYSHHKLTNTPKYSYSYNNNKMLTPSLQSILKDYIQKVNNRQMDRRNFLLTCKSINEYYRSDRVQQFVKNKGEMQRLSQYLNIQFLKELTLQEINILIDFMVLVLQFKLKHYNLQKYVERIVSELGRKEKVIVQLGFVELSELIGRIAALNNSNLYKLKEKIYTSINRVLQNEAVTLSCAQIATLMNSFKKEKLFVSNNVRSYMMVLKRCSKMMDEMTTQNFCKIVMCLMKTQVQCMILNTNFTKTIHELYSKLQGQMEKGEQSLVLANAFLYEQICNPTPKAIYLAIYNNLIHLMNSSPTPQKYLSHLQPTLEKLQFHQFTLSEQQTLSNILKSIFVKSQHQKLKDFAVKLFAFAKSNYFRANIYLIDWHMRDKQQLACIFWDFILHYSYAGVKFPIDMLLYKANYVKQPFSISSDFLTIAISISIQSRLHGDPLVLAHKNTIIKSIQQVKWSVAHIEGFLNLEYRNNKLLQVFFQQYSTYFMQNLRSFCFSSQQTIKIFNTLLLCVFVNCNLPSSYLQAIPLTQIDSFLIKYLKVCKDFSYINPSLLHTLTQALTSMGKNDLKNDMQQKMLNTIVKLIAQYLKAAVGSSETIATYYILLVNQIVSIYDVMPLVAKFQLKEILCKLIRNSHNEPFYGSDLYHSLLETLINNQKSFHPQSDYIICNTLKDHAKMFKRIRYVQWLGARGQ